MTKIIPIEKRKVKTRPMLASSCKLSVFVKNSLKKVVIKATIKEAIKNYSDEVKQREFPQEIHTY